MTVDCLLHHPLVVALDYRAEEDMNNAGWCCRVQVPDAEEYEYVRKPPAARQSGCPLAVADVWTLASRWLQRRGVAVHCTNVGLLEPARRRLWVADITAERDDRLLLAATYYTRRRRGPARLKMRQYAAALMEVCRRCYKIKGASMALVNVYGDGKAEGEFLED